MGKNATGNSRCRIKRKTYVKIINLKLNEINE